MHVSYQTVGKLYDIMWIMKSYSFISPIRFNLFAKHIL